MNFQKIGPGETLDYSFDWSNELGEDTITESDWAISPAGPSLSNQSSDGATATVFVSGCEVGQVYQLTNTIEPAAGGQVLSRSITLRCFP